MARRLSELNSQLNQLYPLESSQGLLDHLYISGSQIFRLEPNGSHVLLGPIDTGPAPIEANVVRGAETSDSITGNPTMSNLLVGNGGDDTLTGSALDDYLDGGAGADILFGLAGNDELFGGNGNDILVGGASNPLPELRSAQITNGAAGAEWHNVGTGDLSGDGTGDVVWFSDSGAVAIWEFTGGHEFRAPLSNGATGTEWSVSGIEDFNGDGKDDLFWVNPSNNHMGLWMMDGANVISAGEVSGGAGLEWHIGGFGDFNADRNSDVVWVNDKNEVSVWTMDGVNLLDAEYSNGRMGLEWKLGGVGDLNHDGFSDMVWQRDTDGAICIWTMKGTDVIGLNTYFGLSAGNTVADVEDFDKDGMDDILFSDSVGNVDIWFMNGGQIKGIGTDVGQVAPGQRPFGAQDMSGEGIPDILFAQGGKVLVQDYASPGDILYGGPGQDTFVFNALNEAGKVISDFSPGEDVIDIHNLLAGLGHGGEDVLASGHLRLISDNGGTDIQLDRGFGAHDWTTLASVDATNPASLIASDFLF